MEIPQRDIVFYYVSLFYIYNKYKIINNKMKIEKENVFGIPTTSFGVSASNSGYTLAYSADGETFTEYETPTPAGEVLIVNGTPKGFSFKLVGNTDTVYIQY